VTVFRRGDDRELGRAPRTVNHRVGVLAALFESGRRLGGGAVVQPPRGGYYARKAAGRTEVWQPQQSPGWTRIGFGSALATSIIVVLKVTVGDSQDRWALYVVVVGVIALVVFLAWYWYWRLRPR
jgi:hypothetical protein